MSDLVFSYLPCFARIVGLLFAIPFFSSRLVPFRFRLAFVVLYVLCLPAVLLRVENQDILRLSDPLTGLLILVGEVFVGLCLGWASLLVMGAVRGAAQFLSDQIGLSLGGVMDPLSEGSGQSVLQGFYGSFAVFIFLSLDLHRAFLRGVTESFQWLPPGSFAYDGVVPALGALLMSAGLFLFESALLMAFPLMAVLLLTSLAQGMLARVLPELDFFAFGFTVRAAIGLLIVLLSLPFIAQLSQNLFFVAFEDARVLVRSLSS